MFYSLLFLGMAGLRTLTTSRSAANFMFFVLLALLYLFVAFRYQVGCDWRGYLHHFLTAEQSIDFARFWTTEPGYWSVLRFVKQSGLEYPYLNVFMAIPFFAGLAYLARRQPDRLGFLVLSFPVLIINMPMAALRQAAAIGFVCMALVAFRDKRLIRYVAFTILAGLFHKSALAFLAMTPFIVFPVTWLTLVAAGVLVLPGAYFMLADSFQLYADRYVDTEIDAAGAIYRSGMLAATGAYFWFFLRKRFAIQYPAEFRMVLVGSLIMVATLPTVAVSTVIADRFGYYVTPIQLIILARLPYLVNPQNKSLMTAAPYLALGLVLVVWTNLSGLFNQCYMPYQNWLFW